MVTIVCHCDPDGYASAAILKQWHGSGYVIPTNYGQEERALNRIPKNTSILYVVDFSFTSEIFQELSARVKKLILIDHHRPVVNKYKKGFPGIVRLDTESAACVLTWKFCYPTQPVPDSIKWISDGDTWTFEYPETPAFIQGLKVLKIEPWDDRMPFWNKMFQDDPPLISSILDNGKLLLAWQHDLFSIFHKDLVIPSEFEGIPILTLNARSVNSSAFEGHPNYNKVPLNSIYRWDSNIHQYRISIYRRSGADCKKASELCQKYNGGGHDDAAGFIIETLPFTFHPTGETVSPFEYLKLYEKHNCLTIKQQMNRYMRELLVMGVYPKALETDINVMACNNWYPSKDIFTDDLTPQTSMADGYIHYVYTNAGWRYVVYSNLSIRTVQWDDVFKTSSTETIPDGLVYITEQPIW